MFDRDAGYRLFMLNQNEQHQILEEAVEWLMQMKQKPLNEVELLKFEQWKNKSLLHQSIWQQANQLEQKFQRLPAHVAIPIIQKQKTQSHLDIWLMILICLPVFGLLYMMNQQQQWTADYRNGFNAPKTIKLPDGGKIILNSNTAIDVNYTAQKRDIILRKGEIWIETQHDLKNRPFTVYTQQGHAQALGTKYLVKIDQKNSKIAVLKGAVKVQPKTNHQYAIITKGQKISINQYNLHSVEYFDLSEIGWTKGLIMVNEIPLSEFVKKLKPYRSGLIYLDPEVSNIKISGTFPIANMPQLYEMLENTYAIDIDRYAMDHIIRIHQKNN